MAAIGPTRPAWPLALSTEQLTIGALFVWVHTHLRTPDSDVVRPEFIYQVTRNPRVDKFGRYVPCVYVSCGLRSRFYLTDAGCEPYGADRWNQTNYLRHPSELELARLIEKYPHVKETLFVSSRGEH